MSPTEPTPQLLALSNLLQLEKEARHADSLTTLAFVAVNETHHLCPYFQAILWSFKPLGGVQIHAISGLSVVEKNAPFTRWILALIRHRLKDATQSRQLELFNPEQIPVKLQAGWQEYSSGHVLWCPFIHPHGGLLGGLVLLNRVAWRAAEITLVERLSDAYAHAWGALIKIQRPTHFSWRRRLVELILLSAVIASLFLTVHESVLVPAEIIATNPLVVSSPLEGTIQKFHVNPNQPVKVGQKLFSLDDTVQKSRHEIAKETLAVAQEELFSTEQKAFGDPNSKAKIGLLRAKVKEREAELQYATELLKRLNVYAEQAGIAVFTDVNDWLGKPVVVGEKIMTLANPEQTELQLWVPVADAINLAPDTKVQLFLNTNPTHPLSAQLYQASYEAELTPESILAFRAKAHFTSSTQSPRIGLKGTAKIYGEEVKLYYYLFRRPWATVRQFFGI